MDEDALFPGQAKCCVLSYCNFCTKFIQADLFVEALRRYAVVQPAPLPMTLTAFPAEACDIVDTAASADQSSTLVVAVKAAGLVDSLKGEGPFTVIAPGNEAFAALPESTVEKLHKPETMPGS